MVKEMKKNNKMVLALVVIAALAMVSVAGIALHSDDSSAAGTYWQMNGSENALIIDETSTNSFNLSVPEGFTGQVTCPIIITGNADYTGTLSIGTLADLTYTSYAAIKLTDAKSVQLTAIICNLPTGPIAVFMIGNSAVDTVNAHVTMPSGTYELVKGQVMLGSATQATNWNNINLSGITDFSSLQSVFSVPSEAHTFVPFNGKVSAGSFSVTSQYVIGAIVSLASDGTARLSGYAASPNEVKAMTISANNDDTYDTYPQGTLSLEGAASIQYPEAFQTAIAMNGGSLSPTFMAEDVDVTVAANAVITAGDEVPTIAQSVTIKTFDTVTEAIIYTGNGNIIGVPGAISGVTFTGVPFGNYSLFMLSGGYVYKGSVTVSATGVSVDTSNAISSTVGFTTPVNLATDSDAKTLTYDSNVFKASSVFNVTQNLAGDVSKAGKVTFSKDVAPGDEILAVMSLKTSQSTYVCDLRAVGDATNLATGVAKVVTEPVAPAVLAAGQIVSSGTVSIAESHVIFQMMDDSSLNVIGTMNFLYNSATNNGKLVVAPNAKLNLQRDGGLVSQGVAPTASNDLNAKVPDIMSTNLAAAYYFTNDTSVTPTKSTYYFTSLQNALNSSKEIHLTGNIVITENITLDNAAHDPMQVILDSGSTLTVGTVGDNPKAPTLTVPGNTELIIADPDAYEVVNGMAVYDQEPEGYDVPLSDILIVRENAATGKYTYTDLATALNTVSKSGDVLDTLRDATLGVDATVKTGVELKDTAGKITITAKKTLTVAGKLTSTNEMFIEGTLRINDGATATFTTSDVNLTGTIDVASGGILTVTDSNINGAVTGALNVDGTANIAGTSNVDVSYLAINGTLKIDDTATLTVTGSGTALLPYSLVIGTVPVLSTDVKNTAAITGVINLGDSALAIVYGSLAVDLASNNGIVSTEYRIYTTPYLTLYSDASASKALPMFYEDQLIDITILNWNNEKMLRGAWLFNENTGTINAHNVGDSSWEIVYAKFEPKMYDVTFAYAPGVTWAYNGIQVTDNKVSIAYGTSITVNAFVQPGFEGTPVLKAGGASYNDGAAYKVTSNVTFTASGVSQVSSDNNNNGGGNGSGEKTYGGLTLIEWLLIIIVIVIIIIAIIVAIRLLRS